MVSLMVFGGVDMRRVGDHACPADLYAIKSQPRAAVLQEEMNRARAWSGGKDFRVILTLSWKTIRWGGEALASPFKGDELKRQMSILITSQKA